MTDEEIKQLMKYADNGFVLVADSDRARILFTSQSTQQVIQQTSQVIKKSLSSISTKEKNLIYYLHVDRNKERELLSIYVQFAKIYRMVM